MRIFLLLNTKENCPSRASIILYLLLLFLIKYGNAQENNTTDSLTSLPEIEFNQHTGKVIKIYDEFPQRKYSSISEISFSLKTRGKKSWHVYHNYPALGASFVFAQFGNRDTLGTAVGIIPTARFEYPRKKGFIFIRAGLGVARFARPYNAENNPGNLVLGSRYANMSSILIGYHFPIKDRLNMSVGLSATHCSNSHLRVPNIGANIVSLVIGLSLDQPESERSRRAGDAVDDRKEKNKHQVWRPALAVNFGLQEFPGTVRPIGGPVYPVYGVSLFASRPYRMNGRVSAGTNVYYYSGYYDYILSQQLFLPGENAAKKSWNVCVFMGREWIFGKMGFMVQAGLNVYAPFVHQLAKVPDLPSKSFLNEWTSNKIGYRYYPIGYSRKRLNPFVGITVKANGGTADFLEFSIGTTL